MMKRSACFFLLLILLVGGMAACQPNSGLSIKDPWARPAQSGNNTAIYFVIDNSGGKADTLLGVSCDTAEACELHLSEMDAAGNMKMSHQENVPVPENQKVSFKPGGLHVMVMDLKDELKTGETLVVTLNFENAGAVKVEAPVREQ